MATEVYFEDSNGLRLFGNLSVLNDDISNPIVIICHGFTIDNTHPPFPDLERSLNENNISTIRIDLFGHGNSEGEIEDLTITKGVDSIESCITFLGSRGFTNISLLGESLGGMCSTVVASRLKGLSALCLKSPVSDYVAVEHLRKTAQDFESWKEEGFFAYTNSFGTAIKIKYDFYEDVQKYNGILLAKHISIPTLVIHGKKDSVVPLQQSKDLVSNLHKGSLKIFEEVGHKFYLGKDFDEMIISITDFFVKNV
jgi:esterase/lipase